MIRLWSLLLTTLAVLGSSELVVSAEQNVSWIQLFNGRDLEGWTPKFSGHKLGENYLDTFRVQDGILKVSYDNYEQFDNKFGHLFYKDTFSHYVLRAEYRPVGRQVAGSPRWALRNNGLMIHGQSPESMRIDQDFPVSVEVQLYGGDGENSRTTGNLCTPGTNVVYNGKLFTDHCLDSSSKTFHGDLWVTAEVEVHGSGRILHNINGETVLGYSQVQYDPRDEDAVRLQGEGGKLISRGTISIQAESHPYEFRKIELLPLVEREVAAPQKPLQQ